MRKIALILFWVVSVGELVAVSFDWLPLHHVCKPLIMITLMGYYIFESRYREQLLSTTVLAAVVFSFLGDSILMYQELNPLYFMLGLVSFLIAHIFYVLAYRQHRNAQATHALAGIHKVRLAFPFLLAGTGLVVILFPHLDKLKVPVIIYATVLVAMVLTALFRFGNTNRNSFWLVFAGAVLFMVSDSLLAINKFLSPLDFASVWIMLTYISAQYLIIRGLIRHV
jgi:uncharacterized membrane protein YhhN